MSIENTIFKQALDNMYVEVLDKTEQRHIDFPEPIKFKDFPRLWMNRTGANKGDFFARIGEVDWSVEDLRYDDELVYNFLLYVWELICTVGYYKVGTKFFYYKNYTGGGECVHSPFTIKPTKLYINI
jgi:hypothetical protein